MHRVDGRDPRWEGLAKGLLVLGVMWWSWVGYAWLTSVVDPEEGIVRLTIFARDGGPARGRAVRAGGLRRRGAACSRAPTRVVRFAQIVLFVWPAATIRSLRRSVGGPGCGNGVGVGLIAAAAFADGALQGALWSLALLLDMGGPYLFGSRAGSSCPATSPSGTG